MRLFPRSRLPETGAGYAGPPPALMRGRASAIADAGAVPWPVLWEALKVGMPDPGDDGLGAELGLQLTDASRPVDVIRMSGLRGGRQVEIRIGCTTRGLHGGGVQITWLRAATQPFAMHADGGALVANEAGATGLVCGFSPSRAWDGMELRGGYEGIVARRPISMRGQNAGWAYDLWLCERLADALATPLPFTDLERADIPYDMG